MTNGILLGCSLFLPVHTGNSVQTLKVDVEKLDADINDIVLKTLFSAEQQVRHSYRAAYPNHAGGSACFEILGAAIVLSACI